MNHKIPELDRQGLRRFAWILAVVVAILFGVVLPLLFSRDWPLIPWVISVWFFLWGLIAPSTVRVFYRLWMHFGFLMNAIMTRVILGIVFYVAILPYGIVFRLLGKDPMHRLWDQGLPSYRVKSRKISASHMEKPF